MLNCGHYCVCLRWPVQRALYQKHRHSLHCHRMHARRHIVHRQLSCTAHVCLFLIFVLFRLYVNVSDNNHNSITYMK